MSFLGFLGFFNFSSFFIFSSFFHFCKLFSFLQVFFIFSSFCDFFKFFSEKLKNNKIFLDLAQQFGAEVHPKKANTISFDKTLKIVTTPAFMKGNAGFFEVFEGISRMVMKVNSYLGPEAAEKEEKAGKTEPK